MNGYEYLEFLRSVVLEDVQRHMLNQVQGIRGGPETWPLRSPDFNPLDTAADNPPFREQQEFPLSFTV